MKGLLISTLSAALIIFFTLPITLKSLFPLLSPYEVFLFIISALVGIVFFFLLYLKPKREFSKQETLYFMEKSIIEGEKNTYKQQFDILENLVSRDSLTMLWNKSYCLNCLQEEFQRSLRKGGAFSVLMLDIDHFKSINDNMGHMVGDEYLVALGNTLRDHTRYSDVICRYGGDEFLIILPETPQQGALAVAEKLCIRTTEIEMVKDYPLNISIGICSHGTEHDAWEEIIHCADMALYRAKKEGRNRIATIPFRL